MPERCFHQSLFDFFKAGSWPLSAADSPSFTPLLAPENATASGNRKDIQNMRLFGATSRTRWICKSSLMRPPRWASALPCISACAQWGLLLSYMFYHGFGPALVALVH